MLDKSFWKGKRVFVTGHSGFKGMWLCKMLSMLGTEIYGYALAPETKPNLHDILIQDISIFETINNINALGNISSALEKAKPDIVFHLAAQPLVIESYADPVNTYKTNVIGTVNILEAIRHCNGIQSVVNITTDKVYRNNEWCWGYRETDVLDGFDPYSNSKSCSELVTATYKRCFLKNIAVSTCRAGNVIGGGDFSENRIIPDCVRAAKGKKAIVVRNPDSVRPYQHVIEPLTAYILIAQEQYKHSWLQGEYNICSSDNHSVTTTKQLVELFCENWGDGAQYRVEKQENAAHESNLLKLDSSKIERVFSWKSQWDIQIAIRLTVEWYKAYFNGDDVCRNMESQILSYWGVQKYEN